MIISHKHKFIFLKTRKTAGTSIEIALSQFCGEKDVITPISPEDEETRRELSFRGPQNFHIPLTRYRPTDWSSLLLERKRARYYNHISAREVRRVVGEQVWNDYFKFCFERNPWDKAVSLYFWRTRRRDPRPSLLRFLNSMDTISLSNFGIYSIDGEIAVDHVGLYEDLAAELERIATLLKLPGELELPRAKGAFRTDRRHYREIMGQEESRMIEQACAREIARFGYGF